MKGEKNGLENNVTHIYGADISGCFYSGYYFPCMVFQ